MTAAIQHRVVLGSIVLLLGLLSIASASSASSHLNVVPAPVNLYNNGVRLCAVDANGNCNWQAYAQSLIRFGAPGIVFAALSFLFLISFIPLRACGGCGGNEPTETIFCPGEDSSSREYSRKEVLSVKIIAGLCILPVIIGVAIGLNANQAVGHSVTDVTSFMLTTANNVTQQLEGVRNELLSLQFTSDAIEPLDNIINSTVSIAVKMEHIKEGGDQYDGYRTSIMYAGFAIALFVLVLGLLAMIFNWKRLGLAAGTLTFGVLVIVWLSFGFHLLSNKLDYDICYEAALTNNNSTNQTSLLQTGVLASLWDCNLPDSPYARIRNIVEQGIQLAVNDTCNGRDNACKNLPTWACLHTLECNQENLPRIIAYPYTAIEVNFSVQQCPQKCVYSADRNASAALLLGVETINNYTNIYQTQIEPLLDCSMVHDVVNNFEPLLCDSFFTNLYNISVASFIVGLFLVPFGILNILGAKRYIPLDDATA